ncbi:MAG: 3-hydroxyacyl-CoA dehydrogenase, partial [Lentisphaeria bacterium]|nr:3-hydroxyacyl-CoA dehydrogenase [Lentisphaeria bacterium]
MTAVRTVGIVGSGTIGASWAAFYALHGISVRVYDADEATAQAATGIALGHLRRLVELGLAPPECVGAARINQVDSLAALCEGVDFVQESVRETLEVKVPLFAELDRLTPPTCLLASSSSGLMMTDIQAAMSHPEKAFIAHPFNPPHIIPLVELVGGKSTSSDTLSRARAFFLELGKEPVVLEKEVPGHIANRLAAALWREAIDLVAQGVASVADVDAALRAGPGLRWAIMGQHMIYHLGGGSGGYEAFIEHIGKAFEEYWQTMPTWTSIPDEAKKAVVAGVDEAVGERTLAEIAAERDLKLAAVLRAGTESSYHFGESV